MVPDPLDNNTILLDKVGHFGPTQGQRNYNANVTEKGQRFSFIYHDFWNVFFEPTPPVSALIQRNLKDMKLVSQHYTSVHKRAKFLHDES